MDNESNINFLTQKLETLPLEDVNYFDMKSESIADLFCFSTDFVPSKNIRKRKSYQKEHVENTTYCNVLYFKDNLADEPLVLAPNYVKSKVQEVQYTKRVGDEIRKQELGKTTPKLKLDYNASCYNSNVDAVKNEENTIDNVQKCTKGCFDMISPIFSEGLPHQARKSSPNKRKRSLEHLETMKRSPLARSCDLEGGKLLSLDFKSIQRTLSFDEELLRYDDEVTSLCSNPKNLRKKFRNRPSVALNRMSCRSQPSSWEEPKGRKVKVLQLKHKEINTKEKSCSLQVKNPGFLSEPNNVECSFQPIHFAADSVAYKND